jgi:hypothetical protein
MKDERSIKACEVALKFADGEATREELADAADAAVAVATYADSDAAVAYAHAAVAAAYAADADAVADAYAHAHAAYADAARIKSQQQTADICREHLTSAVFEKLNLL